MTDISKRLDRFINSAQKKLIQADRILPIKTNEGILVGDVLIISEGNLKHIKKRDQMLYVNVYLNAVAIKLANLCAINPRSIQIQKIYAADQDYGRWFVDSQMLRTQHRKALEKRDYDRADTLYSRYIESRDKAEKSKNIARALADDRINNR
jgi:hypothetical protein